MTSSPAAPPRILTDEDQAELITIAKWQKFLLWGVLLNISITLAGLFLTPTLGLLNVLVALGLIVVLANLGAALGDHVAVRIIYCLGLFLPLISLVILVVVNQRATNILRTHGIPVGFMGARIPNGAA